MKIHREPGKSRLSFFTGWLQFQYTKEREISTIRQELRRICEEAELAGHEIESLKKEAGETAYKLWESNAWEDGWKDQKDNGLQACFIKIQERYGHIERQREAQEKLEAQIRQVMSRSYREEKTAKLLGHAENANADAVTETAVTETAVTETAVTRENREAGGIGRDNDDIPVSQGCVCPNCQAVYRHPAKFCRRCGAQMETE